MTPFLFTQEALDAPRFCITARPEGDNLEFSYLDGTDSVIALEEGISPIVAERLKVCWKHVTNWSWEVEGVLKASHLLKLRDWRCVEGLPLLEAERLKVCWRHVTYYSWEIECVLKFLLVCLMNRLHMLALAPILCKSLCISCQPDGAESVNTLGNMHMTLIVAGGLKVRGCES